VSSDGAKRPEKHDGRSDTEIQVVAAAEITYVSWCVYWRPLQWIPGIFCALNFLWDFYVEGEASLPESAYKEVVVILLARPYGRQFPLSQRGPCDCRGTEEYRAKDCQALPRLRSRKNWTV
jgi:hypothetical protein